MLQVDQGLESAFQDGLRVLARKPLTAFEVRSRLVAMQHSEQAIDSALERLRSAGYVDDFRLALHFVLSRVERLGHGPERIFAQLQRRGVDEQIASDAWRCACEEHSVNADTLLRQTLSRKLARWSLPLDMRAARSVCGGLVRAGFDAAAVRGAVEPHLDSTTREAWDG